jgi:small subunit ribosomal protein S23
MTELIKNQVFAKKATQQPPRWYKALEYIPPAQIMTRPIPPQHLAPKPNARKVKRLYQPQRLVYEEDGLRRQFYHDHPWELARPRIILEMDGRDAERCDWSKGLRQPGIPLTGEW